MGTRLSTRLGTTAKPALARKWHMGRRLQHPLLHRSEQGTRRHCDDADAAVLRRDVDEGVCRCRRGRLQPREIVTPWRSRFDAFISHAGKDAAQAETIEAALGAKRVWLDRSEIRLGALLGRELLSNLRASRALVLVWSKRAAQSPWVQSEWIAAANLLKPIVPIRLDKTALPQALSNALWGAGGKSFKDTATQLARTIRDGLASGPSISPSMRLPNPKLEQEVARLALAQSAMLDAFDGGS